MANISIVQIIRPIANTAEKEYIKEFLRFVGCLISDCPVDETSPSGWDRNLQPTNEEDGVDIVLNYYNSDPYFADCGKRGIKRIYLYFSFEQKIGTVLPAPVLTNEKFPRYENEKSTRENALKNLIALLWAADDSASMLKLHKLYTQNSHGDLFYFLQAKRSLRVLNMSEILQDPDAKVSHIPLYSYIKRILSGLWELYVELESFTDIHCIYARINAARMMREIVYKLYENDRSMLQEIQSNGVPFRTFRIRELMEQCCKLLDKNSQFISVFLLMASLCNVDLSSDQNEELCYLRVLHTIKTNNKKGYAFIWYRIGYFYEKVYANVDRALDCYRQAYQSDKLCYQALFKLGYYAAIDGRFNEAETLLGSMIQTIFHNRSTDPDEYGNYGNWDVLSLKDIQYVYKAYILRAKIAINSNREYSTRAFIGKACLAATKFEEALLIRKASVLDSNDSNYNDFIQYHQKSTPVWAMWKVLQPWAEYIIQDSFVQHIIRNRLGRWN